MGNYYTHVRAMHPEELAFSDFYNKSNTTSSQIRRRYITKIKTILAAATTISEVQVLNPLQVWKDMEVSAPNLCRAAIEMLSIPAQSAASERIFSVMNCVVTKSRCSLKQKNVGPLVQSAMRYKQQRVRKRLVMSNTEDFPPLGLLRLDETQDLIDDNMSDVTYTFSNLEAGLANSCKL